MNLTKKYDKKKHKTFTIKKVVKKTQNNITKTIRKVYKLKRKIKTYSYLMKK